MTHSFPSIHLNTATVGFSSLKILSYVFLTLGLGQDIIPQFGLSFHKPSTLWPPPPDHVTKQVHQGLRQRVREAIRPKEKGADKDKRASIDTSVPEPTPEPTPDPHAHPSDLPASPPSPDYILNDPTSGRTLHIGAAKSIPSPILPEPVKSQRLELMTAQGEKLTIDGQVHMYTPNYLLPHPLVSPVVSYLGGLPPLLVIASDKEVLRDEIMYL